MLMTAMASSTGEEIGWESALIQRARRGDSHAFERLYREYSGRVYGLCLRMTRDAAAAEDCTQEAFINAWRALERFETRSAFGTWIHRIAVNVVLGKRRRVSFGAETATESEELEASDWCFDTPVEESEIEEAIAKLPEGARDVLVLSGIYGYSHIETAQMLGLAEGTCKAQLHRARKLLAERLDVSLRRTGDE
jgi:RNA polymerase sigma-70 factor (ECF subfamily)